jgi:iron complex outermembrane receptor protein
VNFRLGLDGSLSGSQGWSLSANIKNAFNRVYYVGGIGFTSLLSMNTVVPGPPRTFLVEARYNF